MLAVEARWWEREVLDVRVDVEREESLVGAQVEEATWQNQRVPKTSKQTKMGKGWRDARGGKETNT